MTKLHILFRTHSDYDERDVEIVGITDQEHVAKAFVQIGIYSHYWSHEVTTVSLNVLAQHTDVHLNINDWLDPIFNPLCECGHRQMHHRRKNHTGSCKHNVDYEPKHKCKGFKIAMEQKLPALDELKGWNEDKS